MRRCSSRVPCNMLGCVDVYCCWRTGPACATGWSAEGVDSSERHGARTACSHAYVEQRCGAHHTWVLQTESLQRRLAASEARNAVAVKQVRSLEAELDKVCWCGRTVSGTPCSLTNSFADSPCCWVVADADR